MFTAFFKQILVKLYNSFQTIAVLTLNISHRSSIFISSLTNSCFSFTTFFMIVSKFAKSLLDTCLKKNITDHSHSKLCQLTIRLRA